MNYSIDCDPDNVRGKADCLSLVDEDGNKCVIAVNRFPKQRAVIVLQGEKYLLLFVSSHTLFLIC